MKKALTLLLTAVALLSFLLNAAEVNDVAVSSPSMGKQISNMVITPERRSADERFPVVYLLHGYNMVPRDWLNVQPELPDLADRLRLMAATAGTWTARSILPPNTKPT